MRYFLIAFLFIMTNRELLATRNTYEEQEAIIKLAKQEVDRQKQLDPLGYFDALSGFSKVPKQIQAAQAADEHR